MERSIGWLRQEVMGEDERRHALAHELGLPFVKLERGDLMLEALVVIPEPLSREHNLVAYRLEGNTLEVALLDLADLSQIDFLRSQYRLLPRLTSRQSLVQALIRYQQHLRERYGRVLEHAQAPNLLETLLLHALASQASDVHLQASTQGLEVRYRVNGTLRTALMLPPQAGSGVMAALRSLAGLPGGSLPREARVRVELGGESVALRVAHVPLWEGEKMTLHLVRDQARRGFTLESLGLHGEALEVVHKTLLKRRGLVVVEGPAGSGKTTLLYTLLDLLNVPELSLATVEARAEVLLKRVAQTSVSPESGLTVAAALRATLRQDPDVVMVDSIESTEAASLAAAAAARGVFVLAAAEGSERLPAAGLFIRTATVAKLCDKHFAEKAKLSRAQQDELERKGADFAKVLAALKEEGKIDKDAAWKELLFTRPQGCSECEGGYRGRIGLHEVRSPGLPGLNMIEDGLYKAAQGLTSVDEILAL